LLAEEPVDDPPHALTEVRADGSRQSVDARLDLTGEVVLTLVLPLAVLPHGGDRPASLLR